jgi:hypothetical protein
VRLGKHRIAMLDSGYDVGMVTDPIDLLTDLHRETRRGQGDLHWREPEL